VVPTIYSRNNIIYGNDVLGADDRAGVYCASKCIRPEVSVLFTSGEEIGGFGMDQFLQSFKKFPNIKLAIALDRRGVAEYVTYNRINDKVREYVRGFGYQEAAGSFSDIRIFTDGTRIPSVNLSVGFHNEHSKKEFLCIDEMFLTLARVKTMIANPIQSLYQVKKTKRVDKWVGSSYPIGFDEKYGGDSMAYCEICGRKVYAWGEDIYCDYCDSVTRLDHGGLVGYDRRIK
jgi:hypothetical protein